MTFLIRSDIFSGETMSMTHELWFTLRGYTVWYRVEKKKSILELEKNKHRKSVSWLYINQRRIGHRAQGPGARFRMWELNLARGALRNKVPRARQRLIPPLIHIYSLLYIYISWSFVSIRNKLELTWLSAVVDTTWNVCSVPLQCKSSQR